MGLVVIAHRAGDAEDARRELSADLSARRHQCVTVELEDPLTESFLGVVSPEAIVVVLIGPHWSTSGRSPGLTGNALDIAQSRQVRVITLFYDLVDVPPLEDLPRVLQPHVTRPGFWFTRGRWDDELRGLINVIERPTTSVPLEVTPPATPVQKEESGSADQDMIGDLFAELRLKWFPDGLSPQMEARLHEILRSVLQNEGNALANLGLTYAALGEVDKAIGYHQQALVIAREIGDCSGEADALGNLGRAYADLGQVEKAIGYYEQVLVNTREIGDRRSEGTAFGHLGLAYAQLGQGDKAIGYCEQSLMIARETGDRRNTEHLPPLSSTAEDATCSVFAPSCVRAGDSILVQVFAHLIADADEAHRLAKTYDSTSTPKGPLSWTPKWRAAQS